MRMWVQPAEGQGPRRERTQLFVLIQQRRWRMCSDQAQSSMTARTHSFTPGSLATPDTEPLHIANTHQINKEEKDRMLRAMKHLKHGRPLPSLCDFSNPQFSCL